MIKPISRKIETPITATVVQNPTHVSRCFSKNNISNGKPKVNVNIAGMNNADAIEIISKIVRKRIGLFLYKSKNLKLFKTSILIVLIK